jgi:hypothetical protein
MHTAMLGTPPPAIRTERHRLLCNCFLFLAATLDMKYAQKSWTKSSVASSPSMLIAASKSRFCAQSGSALFMSSTGGTCDRHLTCRFQLLCPQLRYAAYDDDTCARSDVPIFICIYIGDPPTSTASLWRENACCIAPQTPLTGTEGSG